VPADLQSYHALVQGLRPEGVASCPDYIFQGAWQTGRFIFQDAHSLRMRLSMSNMPSAGFEAAAGGEPPVRDAIVPGAFAAPPPNQDWPGVINN
jgi:hypothetical protein